MKWKEYENKIKEETLSDRDIRLINKNNILYKTGIKYLKRNLNNIEDSLFIGAVFYQNNKEYFIKNEEEFKSLNNTFVLQKLHQKYPKSAHFINSLEKYIQDDNIKQLIELSEVYLDNKHYFKNHNILKIIKYAHTPESLYDTMTKIIDDEKIVQLCNKLFSSKYKFLLNEENKTLIREIYHLHVSKKEMQLTLMSKIAKCHKPENFTEMLVQHLGNLNYWNIDFWIKKAKKNNVVVKIKKNLLIMEVETFQQCKELGSSQWCISTSEYYFKHYVTAFSRQFIVVDFSKKSIENNSIVGMTIDVNGVINHAYDKYDNEYIDEANKKYGELFTPLNDDEKYEIYKNFYLQSNDGLNLLKRLMIEDNKNYHLVKNTLLDTYKKAPSNGFSVALMLNKFKVLMTNNSNTPELKSIFLEMNEIAKTKTKSNHQSEDFKYIINLLTDKSIASQLYEFLWEMLCQSINGKEFHQEDYNDLLAMVFTLPIKSIKDHVQLLHLVQSKIKDFNKIIQSKSISIKINMAIKSNPKYRKVINDFYGIKVF